MLRGTGPKRNGSGRPEAPTHGPRTQTARRIAPAGRGPVGTSEALTTRIDARNGVTTIALSGELDLATVSILNDQLSALERDGCAAVLLDLRELSFIDSSGLSALVRAYKRAGANGHRFLLVGASPFARRLCEMTGTQFLLEEQGTVQLLGRSTGDGSRTSDDVEAGAETHV